MERYTALRAEGCGSAATSFDWSACFGLERATSGASGRWGPTGGTRNLTIGITKRPADTNADRAHLRHPACVRLRAEPLRHGRRARSHLALRPRHAARTVPR